MLTPRCFSYCSFVIHFRIKKCETFIEWFLRPWIWSNHLVIIKESWSNHSETVNKWMTLKANKLFGLWQQKCHWLYAFFILCNHGDDVRVSISQDQVWFWLLLRLLLHEDEGFWLEHSGYRLSLMVLRYTQKARGAICSVTAQLWILFLLSAGMLLQLLEETVVMIVCVNRQ